MTDPFRVVVADPGWTFDDKLPGKTRGAARNYRTMSIDDVRAFPLPPIADDAWLFLWRVSSMVEEAYSVVRAWGFVPKSEIVWLKMTTGGKQHFGMGRYVRASHETCIVAARGRIRPADRSVRSRFSAVVGRHSEKPDCFFDLIAQLVGPAAQPRLEVFGRRARPGWTVIGDEAAI